MIDLGLSGWMADFGEYLSTDGAVFASGQSGKEVHNQWPVLWAEVNRAAIEERNVTGDVVFWMRAGGAGYHYLLLVLEFCCMSFCFKRDWLCANVLFVK